MFIHVTYTYTTGTHAVGTMTGILAHDPKRIIKEAEAARRKGQMIRFIDPSKGTAHAFPADRLIDIAFRPATEDDVTQAEGTS